MTTERTPEIETVDSTGEIPPVASIDAVAIYDPADGRIVHMHQVITFKGAKRTSPEEQQRNALEHAQRLRGKVEGMATLHVPDFREGPGRCCVDLKKKTLIDLPLPSIVRDRAKRDRR
jgi:hypothetical protein